MPLFSFSACGSPVIGQELAGLRSNEDRTKMLHGERFSAKLDTYTDERNRMYNSLNIPPAKVLQDLGAVNEYDYNLWASDNSVLRLTAYELTYCENGKTVTVEVFDCTEDHIKVLEECFDLMLTCAILTYADVCYADVC